MCNPRYNPLAHKYYVLRNEIAAKERDMKQIRDLIEWYENFDFEGRRFELVEARKRLNELAGMKLKLNAQLLDYKKRLPPKTVISSLKEAIGLSPDDTTLKMAIKSLESNLKKVDSDLIEKAKSQTEIEESYKNDLKKYQSIDFLEQVSKLKYFEAVHSAIAIKHLALSEKVSIIDEAIREDVKQLNFCEHQLSTAMGDRSRAEQLSDELKTAKNSYERKVIHSVLERELGNGDPATVIERLNKQICRHKRLIAKLEDRIEREARKKMVDIRSIIIDGNNIWLLEVGRRGMSILMPLTLDLAKKYDVTIVFDPHTHKIGLKNSDISKLQEAGAKVSITPTGFQADDPILIAASNDEYTYIVSHDGYDDYGKFEAKQSARILRPQIVNDTLMIHETSTNVLISETH